MKRFETKKHSLMMILLAAAFLLTQTILLSSCRNSEREAIEEEVAALREEVAGPTQPAGPEGSENQNETVETAQKTEDADPESPVPQNETETEAHPAADVPDEPVAASVSGYDTILSSEYTVQGGKLYFEAKAKKGRNTVSMPYFIDLTTLASDGLCPDPLCAHEDPAVCKYISMNSSTAFCFADDNTLYWVRQVDGPLAIYKYDLYSDTADKVYTPDIGEPTLLGADGGIVYFKEYEQVVGNGRSVMQPALKGLDVSTDKIVFSVPLPEMAEILFIRDGKAWLNMMRTVTLLDLTSGRQTEICQIPGTLGAWYYDTADESFWFSTINQENNTGSVWEYKAGNYRLKTSTISSLPKTESCIQNIILRTLASAWLRIIRLLTITAGGKSGR